MATYTKAQFDTALRKMLQEAFDRRENFCTVVTRDLHDRVVHTHSTHRMPMACEAMWRLWERQGKQKDRIIRNTPSGRSSKIIIRFSTVPKDR